MGLFDKVLGRKEEGPLTLNQQQAFSAVCVLAVAADGVIEQEEIRGIIFGLVEKKLFRCYDVNRLTSQLNESAREIQRRGAGPVIEAANKALPAELRETAFALATDLILSDGDVDSKEKALLEDLQKALGIDQALALKIAEVMLVKNRG